MSPQVSMLDVPHPLAGGKASDDVPSAATVVVVLWVAGIIGAIVAFDWLFTRFG